MKMGFFSILLGNAVLFYLSIQPPNIPGVSFAKQGAAVGWPAFWEGLALDFASGLGRFLPALICGVVGISHAAFKRNWRDVSRFWVPALIALAVGATALSIAFPA